MLKNPPLSTKKATRKYQITAKRTYHNAFLCGLFRRCSCVYLLKSFLCENGCLHLSSVRRFSLDQWLSEVHHNLLVMWLLGKCLRGITVAY